jgi:uncharacterized membrane protein YhaH (DUF805 family)
MTIVESIKTCLNKYADFTGRASRSEFWWWVLFVVVVRYVLHHFLGFWIGTLFSCAVLIPNLAVGARRLHDTGKSGWWQLLFFVPVAGWIALIVFFVQPGLPTVAERAPDKVTAG